MLVDVKKETVSYAGHVEKHSKTTKELKNHATYGTVEENEDL